MQGWKYIFLKEPGTYTNDKQKYLVAWGKDGTLREQQHPQITVWDANYAENFNFKLKEFQGEVEEQLVENPDASEEETELEE